MTREEFLSTLRKTLQGKVSSDKVQDNITYYHDYIIEEVQKGKSEEEVLRTLGDPGLLAKTIIAADDAGKQQKDTVYDSGNDGYGYTSGEEYGSGGGGMQLTGLNRRWKKLLLVLVVVMVAVLIIAVISGVIRLLAPLVLPIIIIVIVVCIFKRR